MEITHTILYVMIGIIFGSIALANAFNSQRIKQWVDYHPWIIMPILLVSGCVGYMSAVGAMVLIEGWAINVAKLDGPSFALFWVFVVLTGVSAFIACLHTEWYPAVCSGMEDGASGVVVVFSFASFGGIGVLQTLAIFHWIL